MRTRGQAIFKVVVVTAILVGTAAAAVYAVRVFSMPLVQVTSPTRGDVVQAFYATGTISPEREYPIRARVAGILVLEEGIDKGVAVRKDQVLGRVVSDDLEQKLRQSEAELKEKEQRADKDASPVLREFSKRIEALGEILRSTEREYERLQSLSKTDNARQVELDRAFERVKQTWAEHEAAKAQRDVRLLELQRELDVAKANFGVAQWNSQQQELRSPIGGVILDWPVSTRTRVGLNDLLMTIADVRSERLVMRAQVDEEDRNKLFEGQRVLMTLYSFPEDKFLGRLKTIYAKADPLRRTFEVDVEIVRQEEKSATAPAVSATTTTVTASTMPSTRPVDRLAAGMTGELAFVEQDKSDCTILPRQALQGEWFFIVRDGRIDRVKAQPGVKNVTRTEVMAGIGPKDQVMITPLGKLQVGQSVRTEWIDPKVAADMNNPKDTGVFKGGF